MGFARPADGRSGSRARERSAWTGYCAGRRVHRRQRGRRSSRRRQRVRRARRRSCRPPCRRRDCERARRHAGDGSGSDRPHAVELDGTPNKARLGGNATVAVSMAALHAAAAQRGMPLWRHLADGAEPLLPMPMVQIFGGGAHAGRRVDIQDFLVVPIGASTFDEAIVDRGADLRGRGTHHGRARRAARCGGRGRMVARVLVQQRRARRAAPRD